MEESKEWRELEELLSKRESQASHFIPKGDESTEQTEHESATRREFKAKSYMICKTVAMVFIWMSMGMRVFTEITTIPNMRVRLHTDVEGLSYAVSFGALGGLVVAPLAAFADRYGRHSDIILSFLLILAAMCTALKPYCTSLILFAVIDLTQDVVWSIIASVGDSVITSIWGAKAGPPLHSAHTGYTLGAVIAPFIVNAFISETKLSETSLEMENTSDTQENTTLVYEIKDDVVVNQSNFEYAYLICSVIMVVIALIFLVFQFINVFDKKQTAKKKSYKWRTIFNPRGWAEGNALKGGLVFLAMNLFYICHIGATKGPIGLITTYAVDSDLNFTSSEAVMLSSGSAIGGLIGRGLLIAVSGCVSINTILLVGIHGQLIAALCLLFFGTKSKEMLWVFASVFGATVRPLWATGYQWTNDYIILVAFHFAACRMVSRAVDIGQNALQGYLYSSVSIESVFYTSVAYATLHCIVLYAMLLIGRHFGTRHSASIVETKT